MTDTATPTAAQSTSGEGARAPLSSLKLAELQKIASSQGIKGISKMRKGDLVEAISAQRGAKRPATGSAADASAKSARGGAEASSSATTERPNRADRPNKAERPATAERSGTTDQRKTTQRTASSGAAVASENARQAEAQARAERRPSNADEPPRAKATEGILDDLVETKRGDSRGARQRADQSGDAEARTGDRAHRAAQVIEDLPITGREGDPRRRQRGRDGERSNERGDARGGESRERTRDGERGSERGDRSGTARDGARRVESTVELDDDRTGRRRRGRDRYRDRDRSKRGRGRGVADNASFDEIEVAEDDVLVPVAGILDVLDNYAFVRTSGYLPGAGDVYLSLAQVKKAGLRRGDAITGAIRAPRDGEPSGGTGRQKFNALVRLDTVNGLPPEAARKRPDFAKLTPLYPQERLRLENAGATRLTPRVIDIVAPIGKGQRGLIVAPPKAGKTIIMQQIANAITANNPEVHLMVVLVDERPEEVTDMERTVQGEVIASTFDRPASDHTIVAELAIERAKRLVELGQDVVVLLDSLTRLSRAYNLAAPASGRILSGGVDASALYPPKRFFGAARNIEEGGSLTILASALVETGSKMDEVIFEEFKGTGNMELRLSRQLADKRIFPAVDVNASGTRREEVLLAAEELKIIYKLRRVFGGLDQQQAIELLLGKLKETKTNIEFLLQVQKTTPGASSDDNAGRTV